MAYAYKEYYLDDVMSNMGSMMDYAVNVCGEEPEMFYARFLASGIDTQISNGNPRYLAGMSGIDLALETSSRTGYCLPYKESMINMGSPEYWAGSTMAYIQWYLNIDFKTLNSRGFHFIDLYEKYSTLHEADITKSVALAVELLNKNKEQNRMKYLRKRASLTQEDLSARTGINIRTIRAYEQGQLNPEKASARNIIDISKEIGCSPEDLLPLKETKESMSEGYKAYRKIRTLAESGAFPEMSLEEINKEIANARKGNDNA
ncbi:MAG: helix-turn-helix domain-containing protein [Bacteroidales bacterium]|nr:helix-turn-helix domain-containing protein [Bacteroidales bacterium]